MAVGLPLKTTYANGDVYSASDVNDTNGTINITAAPYAAGKNKIINGDFEVWQRGSSFASGTTSQYTADRWYVERGSGTYSVSRQTFTPGTAPVSGYEGEFFFRLSISVAGDLGVGQKLEDVRTLANQTATMSFWAKASSATTLQTLQIMQMFGSGGSGTTFNSQNFTDSAVTTSWKRFTVTFTPPSISGKTIGTGSSLYLRIDPSESFTGDFDIWGVQVEQGSTATAFQTATGTIQGELAACQRYYYRSTADSPYQTHALGFCWNTTSAMVFLRLPVTMRITPTVLDYGNVQMLDSSFSGAGTQTLSITASEMSNNVVQIITSNATGFTANRPVYLRNNNNSAGFVGLSAEL